MAKILLLASNIQHTHLKYIGFHENKKKKILQKFRQKVTNWNSSQKNFKTQTKHQKINITKFLILYSSLMILWDFKSTLVNTKTF